MLAFSLMLDGGKPPLLCLPGQLRAAGIKRQQYRPVSEGLGTQHMAFQHLPKPVPKHILQSMVAQDALDVYDACEMRVCG